MPGKKRQTFGKLTRERARQEKRARKQEKKDERKQAAAEAQAAADARDAGPVEGTSDEVPAGEEPTATG